MDKEAIVLTNVSGRLIDSSVCLPPDLLKTKCVLDLKKFVARDVLNIPSNSIRLHAFHKPLDDNKLISDYNIRSGDIIQVKYLGKQVSWKLVFIMEYYGPLVVHPMVYLNREKFFFWKDIPPVNNIQRIFFLCCVAHFIKRELETLFVHKFSKSTMPLRNIKKNCAYYSLLLGFGMALSVYSPYSSSGLQSSGLINLMLATWMFSQVSNFYTHLSLRALRKNDSKKKCLPKGLFFNSVCCPNYFFEILAWVSLSILTGSKIVWFSTFLGASQMYIWALKKNSEYKKLFGSSYKKRSILIPFIL